VKINRLFYRIYSDFLLPNRINEYREILTKAINKGYEILSVARFYEITQCFGKDQLKNNKYMILRHDVDTDVETLRDLWNVVKDLKVSASYFFRLSSLDINLMQEIASYGSEASYHYEELASYGKKHALNGSGVLSQLGVIRKEFAKNLQNLRKETALPMDIVASHGDWLNRKIGVANTTILKDYRFREEIGIKLETYDTVFMDYVDSRHSDTLYPEFWKPNSPLAAIERGAPVIYLLMHPRHWRSNIKENLSDDFNRAFEEVSFRLRSWFEK